MRQLVDATETIATTYPNHTLGPATSRVAPRAAAAGHSGTKTVTALWSGDYYRHVVTAMRTKRDSIARVSYSMLRKRPNVIDQIPPVCFGKSFAVCRHRLFPGCNLPEECPVGFRV